MANVAVLNTTANVSGKTWAICENVQSITALWTFNRGASAPFAVAAGGAMVANLDADKIDGAELTTLARLGVANAGHLIFTDATYDIGASGATRPRDLFLSRNALIGGTLGVTGVATFDAAAVFSSADNTVKAGASTETLKAAGIINVDSTQAGTGANTTDTTLFTYSLPADALNANGRVVRFTAWGTFGATANNKTVRLKWGGIAGDTIVAITTAANAKGWMLQGLVIRTGSNAQDLVGWAQSDFTVANSDAADAATATQTDSGAITLSVTSQNGTAAANDTVYEGSIIEFLN